MENTPVQPTTPQPVVTPPQQIPVTGSSVLSQPVNPEVVPQPAQKSSKLLSLLLGLLFLVIAGGVGAYYYMNMQGSTVSPMPLLETTEQSTIPNNDDTEKASIDISNLQTYTNSQQFYSVEFPREWSFLEYSEKKTGVGFFPSNSGEDSSSESIAVRVASKPLSPALTDLSLEEYAKVAAVQEIQNYEELATIQPVTTTSNIIGYRTTWMVRPLTGGDSVESLPITYFELPNDRTVTLQFALSKQEDLGIYEEMIKSLKFIE